MIMTTMMIMMIIKNNIYVVKYLKLFEQFEQEQIEEEGEIDNIESKDDEVIDIKNWDVY